MGALRRRRVVVAAIVMRSSIEEAMREWQERFHEELREQQMAFLRQQSEYKTWMLTTHRHNKQ